MSPVRNFASRSCKADVVPALTAEREGERDEATKNALTYGRGGRGREGGERKFAYVAPSLSSSFSGRPLACLFFLLLFAASVIKCDKRVSSPSTTPLCTHTCCTQSGGGREIHLQPLSRHDGHGFTKRDIFFFSVCQTEDDDSTPRSSRSFAHAGSPFLSCVFCPTRLSSLSSRKFRFHAYPT